VAGKDASPPAALIVESQKNFVSGEFVKKVTAYILLVLLGLAISVPAVAQTSQTDAQRAARKKANQSQRKYTKQQRKEQKKAQKDQKKALKRWKKQHPEAR
jgi:Sec-independent protein translocase protein TatA